MNKKIHNKIIPTVVADKKIYHADNKFLKNQVFSISSLCHSNDEKEETINIDDIALFGSSIELLVDTEPVMLTTSDNPFDPFTEFDSWYAFDNSMNYGTCAYLARIAKTSDDLSELDNIIAINSAIDEIVKLNIFGNYMKVRKKQNK